MHVHPECRRLIEPASAALVTHHDAKAASRNFFLGSHKGTDTCERAQIIKSIILCKPLTFISNRAKGQEAR